MTDASGRGGTGTINGATRTPSGRHGSALSFDGVNDLVTVPDSAALDLTNRATLEAWVYPTVLGGNYRTILIKERPGHLVYALYGNNDANRPSGHLFTSGDLFTNGTSALPVNTWTHVAMTWDGTTQRLFINGTQVGTRAVGGTLQNSTGALRFGGNNVWPRVVRRPPGRDQDLQPCPHGRRDLGGHERARQRGHVEGSRGGRHGPGGPCRPLRRIAPSRDRTRANPIS